MTTVEYLTWQRPLYKGANGIERHRDLPLNSIVAVFDKPEENGRKFVEYRELFGWVESEYLEPYVNSLPINCVDLSDMQTPAQSDAEQYVLVNGRKIVNACGMISIAYLAGIKLSEVISTWREKSPNHYNIIDRGNWLTSSYDLVTILKTLGIESKTLTLKRYTPSKMTGREIVAVTINATTGRLSTSGVRHWVVPVSVQPDRQGYGTITIYNPFPNKQEVYSWVEFINSAGIISGVKIE